MERIDLNQRPWETRADELKAEGLDDHTTASILNAEGFVRPSGKPFNETAIRCRRYYLKRKTRE